MSAPTPPAAAQSSTTEPAATESGFGPDLAQVFGPQAVGPELVQLLK